ncbi:MAG: hypothetical protein MJ168_11660 [Clostridia bacterium]|nr:hypothetical protein [Clostridia bacterium]
MTYMKPEMEIEKFDLIEEIAGETTSAAVAGSDGEGATEPATLASNSIGNDLIIG